MKVAYKKRFIRDLNKLPVQISLKNQGTVFEQILVTGQSELFLNMYS